MTADQTPMLDELTAHLTFEQKLELKRELHVGALTFREGDRVAATRRITGSYIDEALEDEGEDATMRFDVPRGTRGRVVKVRQYIYPYPYVVLFDDDTEVSVTGDDLERVTE